MTSLQPEIFTQFPPQRSCRRTTPEMADHDLATLEQCVAAFYSGSQEHMAQADAALAPAREHPRPWELLQAMAARGASTPAVLYCTTLVDSWVQRRWRWASAEEHAACKGTLAPLVVGAAAAQLGKEAEIRAAKLEGVLVRLLRHDWPEGWPDFVPSLLGAALPPAAVLRIFHHIGEDALRHGGPRRADAVRAALAAQFGPVLELCGHALGGSEPPAAALAAGVLARFAPWLPEHAILQPALLAPLPSLLGASVTRSAALQLITSLAAMTPPPLASQEAGAGAAAAAAAAAAAQVHFEALRSSVGMLHVHIPLERLAATGSVPGWTEAQLSHAATALAPLLHPGRHALCRAPSGAAVLAQVR